MIFYFSGTGNCIDISRRLSAVFGHGTANIAKEVSGECSYRLEEREMVGIVCPVYFYGIPLIVEDFIERMTFDREPHFFLVLSFGTFPGNAVLRAESSFVKNGHVLDSVLTVKMPENYVLLFNPPDEREARKILSHAYARLDEFIGKVGVSERVRMIESPTAMQRAIGTVARPVYVYGRSTRRFHVDGTCTSCGKCVRICPDKAIEMVDHIPTWTKSKCMRCMACINRCPSHALQFGRFTKKRERYVNPNVKFD